MRPITWCLGDTYKPAGITPGRPLCDDTIIVAEGDTDTPAYSGFIQATILQEWNGLLDLAVYHRPDPGDGFELESAQSGLQDEDLGLDNLLSRDAGFRTAVIRLLQEQCKLPPGDGFELESAESGLQDEDLAVFKRLLRHGKDVGKAAACLWGAGDGELAESLRHLLGMEEGMEDAR